MTKKIICLVLAAFTALGIFGCKKEEKPSDEQTTQSVNTSTGTEEVQINPNLEAIDGNERTVRFLTRQSGITANYWYEEILSASTSDVVTEAIFNRNEYIKSKYNVKFDNKAVDVKQLESEIEKQVLTQDNENGYDIVLPMLIGAFNLANKGYFYSIEEIPNINPEKPYWFSDIYEATTIKNKNYFIAGDINTSVYGSSWTTFFNEKIVADNKIEDPYTLVKENNWTVEKMLELSKNFGGDNGDGVYDTNDNYAICSGTWVWQCLFYGSDLKFIQKDSNDVPYVATSEKSSKEKMMNNLMKTVEIMNDPTLSINANKAGLSQKPSELFCKDQVLFYFANVNNAFVPDDIKDMESDYGMLPLPKASGEQEYYCNAVHPHHSSCMAVPNNISADTLNLLGSILEDMAYSSYEYVRPAYYENVITMRTSRNERSYEMMPYIFEHYTIDFGLIMTDTLGFDKEIRNKIMNNDTGFSNYFTMYSGIWNLALKEIIGHYGE